MDETGISRRGVLLGAAGGVAAVAAGAWAIENDLLPGRSRAYGLLGLNGDGAGIPDIEGGPRVDGSFVSDARGGVEVAWTVAYPPGSSTDAELPVVVALHASRGDHETAFDGGLAMDRFLAQAVADGVPPFVIVSSDGEPGWPVHEDGSGAGSMVLRELLPIMASRGLDVDRLGYLGWSAGGYGALNLGVATEGGLKVVVATSPALSGNEDPGEVSAWHETYETLPLRIDIGRGDPFYHAVMDFVESMDPEPAGSVTPGAHTFNYWRSVAPEQLAFIGARL